MCIFKCQYGKYTIYQKYVVCTMACVSLIILSGSQQALYSTIPHIINVESEEYNYTEREVCPDTIYFLGPVENVNEKYLEWSISENYYVLICFLIGYILPQIPVGIVCDFHGARHLLGIGVLCTGFVIAAAPVILTETPWYGTAILQCALGFLQGICLPALISLMSHWIPNEQQTFLTAYSYSGGSLGIMISYMLINSIMYHWQAIFYFWAVLTVIWYVVFLIFVYSRSTTHPFVCNEEKLILQEQFGNAMPRKIPWRNILSDIGIWALIAGQMGHNCVTLVMIRHVPKYFKYAIGFDIQTNFYWSSIPYMCQWITTITSGYLADYCIVKKYIPIAYMRMLFVGMGNVLPSSLMLFASYTECNKALVFILFTGAMIARGSVFAGLKPNTYDISRHYSGIVEGINAGLATISLLVIEQIINFLCRRSTISEMRKLFLFSFVVCTVATIFYAIWCKERRSSWDMTVEENSEEVTKDI